LHDWRWRCRLLLNRLTRCQTRGRRLQILILWLRSRLRGLLVLIEGLRTLLERLG
jgi:hypothetical protein